MLQKIGPFDRTREGNRKLRTTRRLLAAGRCKKRPSWVQAKWCLEMDTGRIQESDGEILLSIVLLFAKWKDGRRTVTHYVGVEAFIPLMQRNPAWAPESEQRSPSVCLVTANHMTS